MTTLKSVYSGLGLLAVLLLTSPALADHGSPSAGMGQGLGTYGDRALTTGVLFGQGTSQPQFIIGISLPGIHAHKVDFLTDEVEHYRYFRVTGYAALGAEDHEEAGLGALSILDLKIVPITKIDHAGMSKIYERRILPVRLKSHHDVGENFTGTVHVIGWAYLADESLDSKKKGEQFRTFIKIAADVVGLQYTYGATGIDKTGSLLGGRFGEVSFESGLSTQTSDSTQLRFSAGGMIGLGLIAKARTIKKWKDPRTVGDADLFGRVEYLIDTAYSKLSVGAQAGVSIVGPYEKIQDHHHADLAMDSTSSGLTNTLFAAGPGGGGGSGSGANADDSEGFGGHAESFPYLMLTIGGTF